MLVSSPASTSCHAYRSLVGNQTSNIDLPCTSACLPNSLHLLSLLQIPDGKCWILAVRCSKGKMYFSQSTTHDALCSARPIDTCYQMLQDTSRSESVQSSYMYYYLQSSFASTVVYVPFKLVATWFNIWQPHGRKKKGKRKKEKKKKEKRKEQGKEKHTV